MKFLIAYLSLLAIAWCKTILLTNDDSFVSAEIRALYKKLKDADYDVIIVAPANQRSSYGGAFIVPDGKTLTEDGEFSYVKEGDDAWGQDPDDDDIWYFAGTPAACVSFAFDYLLPKNYQDTTIDLVLSGVNQGPNLSPGYYTSSGTVSGAYSAIYRGYPAIAFGGSNLNNTFFKDSDSSDKYDPSYIYAKKAVELVNLYFKNTDIIPTLTGLNVNFPEVGYLLDDESKCTDPTWILTTLLGSGGIFGPVVSYDDDEGTFSSSYKQFDDLNPSCDGLECSLPYEYDIFWARNCSASVSIFSADYAVKSSSARLAESSMASLL